MKRLLTFLLGCLTTLSVLADVTIDARDLKLYEETAGYPLYILQMEASGSAAQIRIQVRVTAEDYTGTYAIDGDNSALVLPASASNAVQAVSGSVVISRPEGDILVTGSVTCTNGVTYSLYLRTDPIPSRTDSLTLSGLTLEDRILSDGEFQIYGLSHDGKTYLQLTVISDFLEGTYGSNAIYKPLSMVRIKKGGGFVFYDVLVGNLSVRKEGSSTVKVSGNIICQNEDNLKDLPQYFLDLTCVRDKKDPVMMGDTEDADFDAFFDDYVLNTSEQALNGDIFVFARNADNQCVALDVYIADGETEITAGTYPILQGTELSNPYMSVHASEGYVAGFCTPSYAGLLNEESELTAVWFIMGGTVVIDEEGRMEVNAVNSADRTVHCVLRGIPQGLEETNAHSSMSDRKYNILGQPVSDSYHGIVIQNGKKRLQ